MCTHKRAGGPDYNCLNQVIARGQFPQVVDVMWC